MPLYGKYKQGDLGMEDETKLSREKLESWVKTKYSHAEESSVNEKIFSLTEDSSAWEYFVLTQLSNFSLESFVSSSMPRSPCLYFPYNGIFISFCC